MPLPDSTVRQLQSIIGTELTRPDVLTSILPGLTGLRVERMVDQILSTPGLPKYPDHREYDLMMADGLVSDPMQKTESHVLQQPMEVKLGPSKTEAAKLLHAFGEWALRRVRKSLPKVMRTGLDGYWTGWRPHQLLGLQKVESPAGPAWAPSRIEPKPTHLFRWSTIQPDGERRLIWAPTGSGLFLRRGPASDPQAVQIYDTEAQMLGWIHARAGKSDSPYGGGPCALSGPWLWWKLGATFRERMVRAADRSFGAPHVAIESLGKAPHGYPVLADELDAMRDNLETITEVWNTLNVLVSAPGISAKIEAGLDLVTSGTALMKWVQDALRTSISGSVLTATAGPSGSLALGIVQSDVEIGISRMAVSQSVEPMLTDLIEQLVLINIDDEPDPDDLPRVESRIHLDLTLDQVRAYVDMGAIIDLDRVTEVMGHGELPSEPGQLLERAALPTLGTGFGAPPPATPPEDADVARGLGFLGRITRQRDPLPGARRYATGDKEADDERRRLVAASDPEPIASWADAEIARVAGSALDPLVDPPLV